MASVYLDTSFLSALVSTRLDPGSVYRRDVSAAWMASQAPLHQAVVSAEVFNELQSPGFLARDAAMRLAEGFGVLDIDEEVLRFAGLLVAEHVMPGPVGGDAVHVAAACVHDIENLLSWNVRHLANPNKIAHLRVVSHRSGYEPPRIVTPDLLWESRP